MKRSLSKEDVMASENPVIVTTEYKGVFFGYVPSKQKMDVVTIRLARARMCVYWSADVKSVLGLAATGPSAGCRIGPAVPGVTLQKVTSIIEVSPEAAAKFEEGKWTQS